MDCKNHQNDKSGSAPAMQSFYKFLLNADSGNMIESDGNMNHYDDVQNYIVDPKWKSSLQNCLTEHESIFENRNHKEYSNFLTINKEKKPKEIIIRLLMKGPTIIEYDVLNLSLWKPELLFTNWNTSIDLNCDKHVLGYVGTQNYVDATVLVEGIILLTKYNCCAKHEPLRVFVCHNLKHIIVCFLKGMAIEMECFKNPYHVLNNKETTSEEMLSVSKMNMLRRKAIHPIFHIFMDLCKNKETWALNLVDKWIKPAACLISPCNRKLQAIHVECVTLSFDRNTLLVHNTEFVHSRFKQHVYPIDISYLYHLLINGNCKYHINCEGNINVVMLNQIMLPEPIPVEQKSTEIVRLFTFQLMSIFIANLHILTFNTRQYLYRVIQCSRHILHFMLFLNTLKNYHSLIEFVITSFYIIFETWKIKQTKIKSLGIQGLFPKIILKPKTKGKEMSYSFKCNKQSCKYVPMRFNNGYSQQLNSYVDLMEVINYNMPSYDTSHWLYPVTNSIYVDMSNELQRLGTFHSFPEGNCPSFIKMAQAGFFYAGDKRIAICFSCDVSYSNWSYNTNPIEVHRTLSPKCVYLNIRFPVCIATNGEEEVTTVTTNITQPYAEVPLAPSYGINISQLVRLAPRPVNDFNERNLTITNKLLQQDSSTEISTDCGSNKKDLSSQSGLITRHSADSGFSSDASACRNQPYQSSRNGGQNSNLLNSQDSGYGSASSLNNLPASHLDIQTDNRGTELPTISEERQLIGNNGAFSSKIGIQTVSSGITSRLPPPKYPEYQLLEIRRSTYKNWPQHLLHILHPLDLSECGFFYSNFGDCVRCYQCGIGLRNWESDDNPWVEHARWSRKCAYLIHKKGQEFIDTVLTVLGIQTDGQIEELAGTPSESLTLPQTQIAKDTGPQCKQDADPLTHDAAKTVIREKMFNVNLVKQGMDELLTHHDWKSITSDMLVLHLVEEQNDSEIMNTGRQASEAPKKEAGHTSGNIPQTNLMHKSNNVEIDNSEEANTLTVTNPEKVQQENEELKELYTCKICLDEKVGITFVPCGHLVTCKNCSPKIRRCPLCRTFIRGTIKTTV